VLKCSGVHVGQVTVGDDGSDVCKGVTVILPRHPDDIYIPSYAGMYTLNGNGEVSGSYQIKDWGYINTVWFSFSGGDKTLITRIAHRFNQLLRLRYHFSFYLAMDFASGQGKGVKLG